MQIKLTSHLESAWPDILGKPSFYIRSVSGLCKLLTGPLIITINGGCSLYVPVHSEFEMAVSVTWFPAIPPSNRPSYGYSCLKFTLFRDI